MRTKHLALLLVLVFVVVGFFGCDGISFRDPVEKRRESISKYLSKDVAGKIGDTYKTKWFEFTIESIEEAEAYLDYKAKTDYQLYKIQVTLKSNWDKPIPMGTFDFYMDDPSFEEYIWAIPPLDDSMMPKEYDLGPGKSAQYLMIFEVPINTTELALLYTESFEGGSDGKTFAIYIEK